ncbi:putative GCN5-related N-acetyltransferase [Blastococcus saxobsidens DD2]|uniref:Putative GCN5-related N-acetyltransferase n=2 Tax=Blastococcus saxobsidens TaxID=138336 RepID=H6RNN1_BLASD|nr:putative GCN5-related N-acetyltransferase [Blastococcus saxobsidens DD2]
MVPGDAVIPAMRMVPGDADGVSAMPRQDGPGSLQPVLRIRPAADVDAPRVAALHGASVAASVRATGRVKEHPGSYADRLVAYIESVRSPRHVLLYAELWRKPVGFALLGPPSRKAEADGRAVGELCQLHVLPTRRRRYIGSALHAAALRWWRHTGEEEAWSTVRDDNVPARRFLDHHGWQLTDPARDLAGAVPWLTYRLPLTRIG